MSDSQTDREMIIRGCEYWVKNHKDESLPLAYSSVVELLALLKEQEVVEPEVEVLNEIDRIYRCPKCHKHFFYEKQKYCDQCGQAVKWE